MKHLSRVAWFEGMYLGPHHFQVQNRYLEDSIHFVTTSLWFEPWGMLGFELDREALQNGTVAVVHARGIFPDGLAFYMPESDPLPPSRNITEAFSPVRDSMTVLLGVPRRNTDGLTCALSGADEAKDTRYVVEIQHLHDETTGRDEKPVPLGRKNIRLYLDTENSENLTTLPLARIVRDGAGHFVFDPNFIPPCLQISASEPLMMMLQRLIEILGAKSDALTRQPAGGKGTPIGLSQAEVAQFWFLHCVNSGLAPLQNFYISKRGHPEALFVEMSRLAGALCTFALESHPETIPSYDHRNLSECFDALDRHIRFNLEAVIPTNAVSIPLRQTENYFYTGDVADERCLHRSRWIFGIRSPIGEADLIAKAMALVKICSKEFVSKLVQRALPGLTLAHLPVPPSAISPKVEYQYFSLSKAGPCWDHIVKTREIGIYIPGEVPEPEIELAVILES
jgi:type VI secretion system protein ImpJ